MHNIQARIGSRGLPVKPDVLDIKLGLYPESQVLADFFYTGNVDVDAWLTGNEQQLSEYDHTVT